MYMLILMHFSSESPSESLSLHVRTRELITYLGLVRLDGRFLRDLDGPSGVRSASNPQVYVLLDSSRCSNIMCAHGHQEVCVWPDHVWCYDGVRGHCARSVDEAAHGHDGGSPHVELMMHLLHFRNRDNEHISLSRSCRFYVPLGLSLRRRL